MEKASGVSTSSDIFFVLYYLAPFGAVLPAVPIRFPDSVLVIALMLLRPPKKQPDQIWLVLHQI